jgi:hypothetical protein
MITAEEANRRAKQIAERAALLPPTEGDRLIRAETKDFPDGIRQLLMMYSAKLAEQIRIERRPATRRKSRTESSNPQLKVAGFVTGVAALATVVILIVQIPAPTAPQWWVFRFVASLGGAGFTTALCGFLELKTRWHVLALVAGGGFAVFCLTYLWNPPALPSAGFMN